MYIECKDLSDCMVGVRVTTKNQWWLRSDETRISYQLLKADNTTVGDNEFAAIFTQNGTAELRLALTNPTAVYPVGTYTDTLTFTVESTK